EVLTEAAAHAGDPLVGFRAGQPGAIHPSHALLPGTARSKRPAGPKGSVTLGRIGGVAQPGRALPSHGRGQGFKSPHLHTVPVSTFEREACPERNSRGVDDTFAIRLRELERSQHVLRVSRRAQATAHVSTGGLSKARLNRVHDVMVGYVERGEVPGIVTLVSRRGEVHVDALGTTAVGGSDPIRRDTIFRIASLSKPIAAVAAMILVEECTLRLDEPVDR